MKIDKITGSVPNCIVCQIAHDDIRFFTNSKYFICHLLHYKLHREITFFQMHIFWDI